MKQSVWLYLALLFLAHPSSGRVLFEPKKLSSQTGFNEATLRSWLGHLRKGNYVTLRTEHGKTEVTISGWRVGASAPQEQVATWFHRQPSGGRTAGAEQRRPVPALKDADRAYATALASSLQDEENVEQYEALLAHYSREQLKQALEATLRVPRERIRKSRSALFLYLLKKSDKTT